MTQDDITERGLKMIELKEFERILSDIQQYTEIGNAVDRLVEQVCSDFPPVNLFGLAQQHISNTLGLLRHIFNDKSDWIAYWVWELDFGDRDELTAVTENGKEIPLKTTKDLYTMLIKAGVE